MNQLNLMNKYEPNDNLSHYKGNFAQDGSSSNMICLEDHRLLIDRAIDKLKGEINEKEKELIQPLAYRQRSLLEEHTTNKKKIENRLRQLEQMVEM